MIHAPPWPTVPGALTRLTLLIAVVASLTATRAQAHPHVWATIRTELLYAPDGAVTGVRNIWTFDDMYSAYATTGIQAKVKGQFTRAELQPLARLNVESLKEYAYFTYARTDGKKQKDAFLAPVDYWLDYDPKATVLTLHFTLPFKQGAGKAARHRDLRSGILHRFRFCRQQPGRAGERTGAMRGHL
jgi:ABC-type uncharacterized transport system substrate-binding protein